MNGTSTYTFAHNFAAGQAQDGGQTIGGQSCGFVDIVVLNLPTGTAGNYDISVNTGALVSWTASSGSGSLFDQTQFSAAVGTGEYVLQIAGVATSAGGGSYTAGIGVTAVPLPAALPLLLCGIAGLGAMTRRRRVSLA